MLYSILCGNEFIFNSSLKTLSIDADYMKIVLKLIRV